MNSYSFDTGTETFERDVLRASAKVPVLVDFWAPWCAPCRVLKPVLEKLVAECQGRFMLAKVNSDEHPQLSARFGVRGIPNVKAFVDGKLADEFTGALPESGVRADKLYSALALWKRGQQLPALDELEARLAANPDDLPSLLALGERLIADKRFEPALAALLEVVRRDRGAQRTSARKLMVEVFRLAEDQSELVSEYRKLLAGALY